MVLANTSRLKMSSFSGSTTNGVITIEFKIPSSNRILYGGFAWFSEWVKGDKLETVDLVDIDGLVGPTNTVLGSFHDEAVSAINYGWYIPPSGVLEMPNVGGAEFGPGGMYIRLKAKTGDSRESSFYVNVRWGDPDQG